jgi:hypothetical protein
LIIVNQTEDWELKNLDSLDGLARNKRERRFQTN